MKSDAKPPQIRRRALRVLAALLATAVSLSLALGTASASKEVVAFFGGPGTEGGEFGSFQSTNSGDIAVNTSGAGPASPGDIYVLDAASADRIQRFATDDNGTPADPYDDTYPFLSAWGADVDATPDGGSLYEICTVAAECQAAADSDGNGGLANPSALDIDEDTGDLYVADTGNNRINVYSADGLFLRSFGSDVVATGPGDTGTGHEVCVAADGDVCKAGTQGAGVGQIANALSVAVSKPDGNPATGNVFVADQGNLRVNTYALNGTAPGSFGSGAQFHSFRLNALAVDSRGIVYIADFNNGNEIDRYDSADANGGGVGFLASIPTPPLTPGNNNGTTGLEVDPDSDGPGPDEDSLYVLRTFTEPPTRTTIQQFGPINAPGLTAPPAAVDDTHGQAIGFAFAGGLGLDSSRGRLFVATSFATATGFDDDGVYVLDTAGGTPTASLDSVSDVTATSATIHATVDPNGPPPVSYRLEYSTDGSNWASLPSVVIGSQDDPQALDIAFDPPGVGLDPSTLYHVRLQVTKAFNAANVTNELTFTTLPAPPAVETTGAPIRTIATAQLTGRVNPRGSATNYHFEYGEAPCDSSSCASTPVRAVGSGNLIRLVAEPITGLQPDTIYHYRLVADNGTPGSPATGEDRTVTTRAPDVPLSHGPYPGPPGSDRAWELVSAPDTSGNPVAAGQAFSVNGDRAAYSVLGGSPGSAFGSAFSLLYAERPAAEHPTTGWQTVSIEPPRSPRIGSTWALQGLVAPDDLSELFTWNEGGELGSLLYGLAPGAATELAGESDLLTLNRLAVAGNGATVVVGLTRSFHPAHLAGSGVQLYDVASGTPELVSFLPDGSVGPCNPNVVSSHSSRGVSPDGSLLFFGCGTGLYVRDLGADATSLIASNARFIKSTPGAVFFVTEQSLDVADEGGADVYRYDLATADRTCVTCVVPGLNAAVVSSVSADDARTAIAVAGDGSRVYFRSANRLLSGAPEDGIYRVEVATGDLAFIADIGNPDTRRVGEAATFTEAISYDGSHLVFGSDDPDLNPLGGQTNAGSFQYYLYDDADRALTCVSCPADGSPPLAPVAPVIGDQAFNNGRSDEPYTSPLSDGGIFAFSTLTPLLGADQNTPGPGTDPERGGDVYEWRDGRLLLVTDGITSWPATRPRVEGISPSGRDLFLTASARYTSDALDDNFRLYDARIGGGVDFPDPESPCPLEACQGNPSPPPSDPAPGSSSFPGTGNQGKDRTPAAPAKKCRKGKKGRKCRQARKRNRTATTTGRAGR